MIVGLDLGQLNDFTGVAVLEPDGARGMCSYAVRLLERWRGVPYPEQVARVGVLLDTPELCRAPLVVDATGVGRAIIDLLHQAGLEPHAVTITGGNVVTEEPVVHGGKWYREHHVPKRDLVAAVTVLLQSNRLQIAKALPHAATLAAELVNFRIKVSASGHDSYEAWREQDHDDLVLSVALAAWWGECGPEERTAACW